MVSYHPQCSTDLTFVKDGQPCSRIDAAYGNRALLRWGDADKEEVHVAITRKCEPLSCDHRCLIVRLVGPFTRAAPEGYATAVSAVPRPRRASMTEESAFKYKLEAAAPGRGMRKAGEDLQTAAGDWSNVRRALDVLGLTPRFNAELLQEAEVRISGKDIKVDARGQRRAEVRSEEAQRERVQEHTTRLEQTTDGGMRAICSRQGRGGGRQQANGRLATLETLGVQSSEFIRA